MQRAARRELRDDLPVEVRPRRLTVQEQHWVSAALVDVVHPEPVLLDVARLEIEARQVGETLVGRAVGVDHLRPPTYSGGGASTIALRRVVRQLALHVRAHGLLDADVSALALREEPAVLEHLVEQLGGRQSSLQVVGHRGHGRFEDLLPPFRGDHRLGELAVLAPLLGLAVARDVVQHPARLPLLRVEAGQAQQPVPVVPRLDHVRVES